MHSTDAEAYVRLSIHEGVLEISGPVGFVSDQVDRFEELILKFGEASAGTAPLRADPPAPPKTAPVSHGEDENKAEELYPDVFARRDDKLTIIGKLPGSTNADKMAQIGLLLGYGYDLEGQHIVDKDEVAQQAKDHAAFDSANFKRTFKSRKNHFVIEGSSQNWTLKLTRPGREEAQKLVDQMSAANE